MAGKRDCDKRHVRLVQALRSALLGVKTDMTLGNLQAPRSNCAVAKGPKEKCFTAERLDVHGLRFKQAARMISFTDSRREMLPSRQKRA